MANKLDTYQTTDPDTIIELSIPDDEVDSFLEHIVKYTPPDKDKSSINMTVKRDPSLTLFNILADRAAKLIDSE